MGMRTAEDMIADLSQLPPGTRIMILDGHNGGGFPREINLGPSARTITAADAAECADCEGMVGESVVVLGYGCY